MADRLHPATHPTTAPDTDLIIRELHGAAEMNRMGDLEHLIWGGPEREIFPPQALRAIQHAGGLVAGAFHNEEQVGLVAGFPTADPQVHHSHMMGVHPDWRGTGLAQKLKEYQRDWCVARGMTRMEWTYDPLRALNAHFNLHRLGCVAHEYLPDFYGEMGGINAGMPSDRLLVRWDFQATPQRLANPEQAPALNHTDDGAPLNLPITGQPVRLHIPRDITRVLAYDPAHALAWRLNTRHLFLHLLEHGYQVSDFLRGEHPAYLLTPPP